ncbi:MAG: hypothetical protein A2504_02375 [Bdellovibrionales bacterium RIFOXYD12_FULL_39_22]|nr:MAG: hypothetical protein A2385_12405 [Bdellovibrionales bacterium RIFOXYB1_FULL_39_21]OFZ41151.1 MAG: hypothetical protein A2485_00815 [Bdellovibrionales bacterium RIFOXYC12_FULL_39_17]OFZ44905.1 MAG: hypothetical protein A2404_11560 [Bdellovibrionales bacterium RIFOXYC1_FULL_39_130]OFZ74352.1 MAG: hypothetical protein A2560_11930 [Bdellovibrionales bacterium RIFOXYD1_FULL_39_84]OFZ74666.1 MAG: hypothetical protein A2451_08485 [Bdellovibrionales bacterium RIFOXYC2_FULL_39_8]OFZ92354.1 MAG:
MKVALIGNGKTGHHVADLLTQESYAFSIFNLENPPTLTTLSGHDVIINFTPGEIFLSQLDLLIASKIPLAAGSTGLILPENLDTRLKSNGIRWIYASNFSLGMALANRMLKELSHAKNILNDYSYTLNETHHTKKVDNPSGTALAWAKIIDDPKKISITGHREGEVVGIHELTLNTPFESITLKHVAHDRKIFAQGAIWAAKKLLSDPSLPYGLHYFSNLAGEYLYEK